MEHSIIMSLSHLGLDAFETIAELGTIVLASERLGVTQTALTQRIKSLELELQTSLFTRSRKGMALTHEGKILHKYCTERKTKESLIIQKIKGLNVLEPRRIRISGPTLQTQTRFLESAASLKKSFPELFFTFDIDDSSDLLKKLKDDQVDFVITSALPSSSLKFKKLNKSEFVLVGPYSWRKRELKEIIKTESIIDFNSQDTYTSEFLKKHKLLPNSLPEKHYINNTHQMLMMVEMGLGYAVFDIKHVRQLFSEKKLYNMAPQIKTMIDWYLCWSDYGPESSPFMDKLISTIESAADKRSSSF